ncbi:hypothetical protein [Streptomyces sp. NPDC047097]|uniref:DUF7215 family protein n=1 Tax=Streptomyces sp. NPDC047097 TaxID=3155260 RepID=UPI0033F99BB2
MIRLITYDPEAVRAALDRTEAFIAYLADPGADPATTLAVEAAYEVDLRGFA